MKLPITVITPTTSVDTELPQAAKMTRTDINAKWGKFADEDLGSLKTEEKLAISPAPRARARNMRMTNLEGAMETPFIVRVRTSAIAGHPGSSVLYVAVFPSEAEALKAIRALVPSDWQVEDVIGHALTSLVERRKITPGSVVQL